MSYITVQDLLDGHKNCAVKVTGFDVHPVDWAMVVDLDRFKPRPVRVKIDHIEWDITAGLEVFLGWNADKGRELILPLGGRGSQSFTDYGGLSNQGEGRSGHIEVMIQPLSAYGTIAGRCEAFTLLIDLIKQG